MARNVAVFAIALTALSALPSLAGGKGLLVLQCGSDWCVSGEDVRKVFEGSEFRKLLAGKYELAVYDDMEDPPPKVKAENERLARWRVASRRFCGRTTRCFWTTATSASQLANGQSR